MIRIPEPESDFQAAVCELAEMLGYAWMHVYPLMTKFGARKVPISGPLAKGWPDLVFLGRGGRVVLAELKKRGEKLRPDQEEVHAILRRMGHEVYTWRPDDFEEIKEVLQR